MPCNAGSESDGIRTRDRVDHEAMSCVSYVLLFRPIFCHSMPWRTRLGDRSELGAGSIVPASGAGGLAPAWILREGGMPAQRIASRSVAFFLIKSSVNFIAVAVLGTVMAVVLVGPDLSLRLTAVPAAGAMLVIAGVLAVPRLGPGAAVSADAGRTRKAMREVREALVGGTTEAVQMVRSRNVLVIAANQQCRARPDSAAAPASATRPCPWPSRPTHNPGTGRRPCSSTLPCRISEDTCLTTGTAAAPRFRSSSGP
jgi:hypothetical protein